MDLNNTLSEHLTTLVDQGIQARHEKDTKRNYLGASRLNLSCSRALQYEYFNTPKDPGENFSGRVYRIFEAGHVFESLMLQWLYDAGFSLITEKSNGEQFGFSVLNGKIQGHIDGLITESPRELGFHFPMLWEAKSLNNKSWNDTVRRGLSVSKPIYAGQIALYQAYMETDFPGIHEQPALFTAINKDTAELHFELVPFNGELAQRASDRGVRIIEACEAQELLPRISKDPAHFECRMCSWSQRCWQEVIGQRPQHNEDLVIPSFNF